MMMLRPLLVKKIACGLGKSDRFKSIYAALYFFPILTVLQAVGGGLLCKWKTDAHTIDSTLQTKLKVYDWPLRSASMRKWVNNVLWSCFTCLRFSHSDYAFPYIILVLSLVTLAVYMTASEIQVRRDFRANFSISFHLISVQFRFYEVKIVLYKLYFYFCPVFQEPCCQEEKTGGSLQPLAPSRIWHHLNLPIG